MVVGLGNPGEDYKKTRHNIGFMVVDALAERYEAGFTNKKDSFLTKIYIEKDPVLLIKPATFMNASGEVVRKIIDYHKITDFSKILIVLDDINIPFGAIRLRSEGSDGGQKGLRSIIKTLKTSEIPRLRTGIGSDFYNATSHVLSPFNIKEKSEVPKIINWAVDAIESFVLFGIEQTMNKFNRNIIEPKNEEDLN
jgi:PTH1 family peptidyl-tRNA hydrolase